MDAQSVIERGIYRHK